MVIDLTKNNSISSIKNIDEDLALSYYKKLNLDHSSPSQEALSDSDWLVRYCHFTQEDRRLMNISYRMTAGVSIGRASQRFVSKYMFDAEKKILNEKKDLDTIIKEEFEAADITQETQEEQPQEEVAQEEVQQETVEDLPPKYKGKSLDEIIKMHQEAEKLIGRQAQEVGEVRKLADELIKRQLEPKKEEIPAAKEDEIDYYDDPKKAVHKAIEEHPAVKEAKQQALEMKKMQMLNRLASEFPDFHQTANDPEFAEWLKASPVRLRLYAEADGSGDYDAAAELLSTWNYVKPKALKIK